MDNTQPDVVVPRNPDEPAGVNAEEEVPMDGIEEEQTRKNQLDLEEQLKRLAEDQRIEEEQLLRGAAGGTQLLNANRDQLMLRIEQLERQVASANDDRDKYLKERNQLSQENASLKKDSRIKKKKAAEAEQQRVNSQAALVASFRGDDVASTRAWRNSVDDDEIRKIVRTGSRLHPDYKCVECGRRKMGVLFPTEKHVMGKFAEACFDTLRECAALCDMREEWTTLTTLKAHNLKKERVDKKEVSSNALKKAYEFGICDHALPAVDAVAEFGVLLEDEDPSVSDAISEVLMRGGGRKTRKPCVVLAPTDSVLVQLRGSWKEIEEMRYTDDNDLKTVLQGMESAGSFPKSLWLMVKSTFNERIMTELRAYLDAMTKKADLTCYVSADVLPAKPSDMKIELVKTHQQWLTSWKLDGSCQANLMIVSQLSGLIWKIHPFVSLFVIAQNESKDLLEKAIKHIVDGIPFALETGTKSTDPVKRSFPGKTTDNVPVKKYIRSIKKCRICQSTDHLAAWHTSHE